MATLVYALCAMTALLCAVMLLAGARGSGSRMLFWSGLCFAGLFVTNLLVVMDALDLLRGRDLATLRLVTGLVSVALLLYGLIFEED